MCVEINGKQHIPLFLNERSRGKSRRLPSRHRHTHSTSDRSNEKVYIERVRSASPYSFYLPPYQVRRWKKRWEKREERDRLMENSYQRCKGARLYALILVSLYFLRCVAQGRGIVLSLPFSYCILMVTVVSSRFFRNGNAGKINYRRI